VTDPHVMIHITIVCHSVPQQTCCCARQIA